MNDKDKIQDIRKLVSAWYAAELNPDDERRLYQLLDSTTNLPPDIESDKKLICALRQAADEEFEMPLGCAERINSALEQEMACARLEAASRSARFRLRRWMGWGAAAVVVVAFGASFLMRHDNDGKQMIAELTTPDTTSFSSEKIESAISSNQDSILLAPPQQHAGNLAENKKTRAKNKYEKESISAQNITVTPDTYEFEEEEEKLLAANYHVITDEKEADAMLASVFSRLESQMTAESVKLEEINGEYQNEMTKIYVSGTIN